LKEKDTKPKKMNYESLDESEEPPITKRRTAKEQRKTNTLRPNVTAPTSEDVEIISTPPKTAPQQAKASEVEFDFSKDSPLKITKLVYRDKKMVSIV
jgi:hypothetical protein